MRTTPLCAILALAFSVATAQATTAPMVDGVSNGVSTKYNQNCLDVAYKNAYEEADGKKTDSSTFPNYKCYKDGKEIYCNEVREDGQTENAKTDHFVNQLPDGLSCVGVPESQKVYEGSVVSCDDVAYKNGYCKASGVSPCDLSGFKCYQDRVAMACSDVTDEAQNKKAEADYLTLWATTRSLSGHFVVKTNKSGNGYGNSIWRNIYDNELTNNLFNTNPPKGVTEFLCKPDGWCNFSINQKLLTASGIKTIRVTVNGQTVEFSYVGESNAGLGYDDDPYWIFTVSGDQFNLKQYIGQNVHFFVEW